MVTEKDIMNMHRKIKRSNNPKTLARYQAQIDAWIAELAQDQARTQADILALEEKIKMEEEAKEAENKREQDPETGKFIPEALPRIGSGEASKEQAKKIAEKAGPRKCYSYFEFERLHLRRSRF
jgi:hypothetical protein